MAAQQTGSAYLLLKSVENTGEVDNGNLHLGCLQMASILLVSEWQ